MARILFILSFFLINLSLSLGQDVELEWAIQLGGSQLDVATNVCLDNQGNVIVGGYYEGRIDVDPGSGYQYLEHVDDRDAYIAKLNPSGDLIWAIGLVGQVDNGIREIKGDAAGFIYVLGSFYGTIDMDPSEEDLVFNSKGESDVFIGKFDPNGHLVWAREIGNEKYNFCNAFMMDDLGNLFISSNFSRTLDCDPDEGIVNLTSFNDRYDFFLLKLNADGQFVWVKHFKGESYENAISIDMDSNGNIYLAGYFYQNIDLDPGIESSMFYSQGEDDAFICKLDSNGDLIWANSMGGDGDDNAGHLTLDSFGNFYISGSYDNSIDLDPGLNEFEIGGSVYSGYIAKYSQDGDFIWARNIASAPSAYIYDMKIDPQGNIMATGYFRGDRDFDPSDEEYVLNNASSMEDIFVLRLNESGQLIWAKAFVGIGQDYGHSIAIDDEGNIFTAGGFGNSVDFDPGEGIKKLIVKGYWDGFVQKLKPCREEYHESLYGCNGSFVSPGGLIWDTPGSYIDSIIAPHRCEAVYYIDLDFVDLNNSVTTTFNTLRASQSGANYQWIYFDKEEEAAPINGADEQTYTATVGGHYAVIIELNGCVDTSAFYKLDDILFGEVEMRKITVFPNPSAGKVYIDLGGGLFKKVSIGLFDAFGNLKQEQEIENDYYLELNVPEPGIYTLKIELEEAYIIYKKVIVH